MSRINKIIICVGLFVALVFSIVMTLAAWEHNPQNMFRENSVELSLIFLSWFLSIFLFIGILVVLFELVKIYKKRL